jgi:hypothetical protein
MTTDHKLSIEAAGKNSAIMEDRVRFLVACAEAEPIGSEKRNDFNQCIEELLFWGKTVRCLLPPDREVSSLLPNETSEPRRE